MVIKDTGEAFAKRLQHGCLPRRLSGQVPQLHDGLVINARQSRVILAQRHENQFWVRPLSSGPCLQLWLGEIEQPEFGELVRLPVPDADNLVTRARKQSL